MAVRTTGDNVSRYGNEILTRPPGSASLMRSFSWDYVFLEFPVQADVN
jgi:hypothetical protein